LRSAVQKRARSAAEMAVDNGITASEASPLDDVILHSLRHSFVGVAERLGATIDNSDDRTHFLATVSGA
jgi:hypothetical protein